MIAVSAQLVAMAFICVHAEDKTCVGQSELEAGSALIQSGVHVSNANLDVEIANVEDDWQPGTATYYGDGGSGGACGGSELGDYGTDQSWIDGLYAATSSSMWCGSSSGSCGTTHAPDCGRCYEVKCTGTDTNTDGYEPCTGSSVSVAVTDECPGGSALLQMNHTHTLMGHCGGNVQHFDLSTKAFKIIGNERAGVIKIEFRRVSCSALGNLKLRFHGTRWWFKVAPWDVNGPGTLTSFEVKNSYLGGWTALKPSYGAFWVSDVDINDGPYEFRLTADDGQVLLYTLDESITSVSGSVLDIGKNFQGGSEPPPPPAPATPSAQPTSLPTSLPTPAGGDDCASAWAQCGGKGFSGPTCCKQDNECVFDNDWWSMCKPTSAAKNLR